MPYVPSDKTPLTDDDRAVLNPAIKQMSEAIATVAARHKYEGAFAGELNYTITRLIQEMPRELVKVGSISEEMRYWIQPLMYGVLFDVVLEHKRRVNVSYEAHQIVKSGDCYDTPYYTKLIEVKDAMANHVGYQEVMVKRDPETVNEDIIGTMKLTT